ncbi:MAG TPA: hypothetical protein VHD87_15525 [Acidimicrobiales bacterium]|nr:hypothetical protein [Acidimicrobiales bacterium]
MLACASAAVAGIGIWNDYQLTLRTDTDTFRSTGLAAVRQGGQPCDPACASPRAQRLVAAAQRAHTGARSEVTDTDGVFVARHPDGHWYASQLHRSDRQAVIDEARSNAAGRLLLRLALIGAMLIGLDVLVLSPLRRVRRGLRTAAIGGDLDTLRDVGGSSDLETLGAAIAAAISQRDSVHADELDALRSVTETADARLAAGDAALTAAEAALAKANERERQLDAVSGEVLALLRELGGQEAADRAALTMDRVLHRTSDADDGADAGPTELTRIIGSVAAGDHVITATPAWVATNARTVATIYAASRAGLTRGDASPVDVTVGLDRGRPTLTLRSRPGLLDPFGSRDPFLTAHAAAAAAHASVDVLVDQDGAGTVNIVFPSSAPPPAHEQRRAELTAPLEAAAALESPGRTNPRPSFMLGYLAAIALYSWLCASAGNTTGWKLIAIDAGGVLAPLTAGIVLLQFPTHRRRGWWIIAAGCLAWAAADLIWSVAEIHFHTELPFPSAADAGYLLFAVSLLFSVRWLWPTEPEYALTRFFADGMLITASVVAVLWGPVLEPLFAHQSGNSFIADMLSLLYPSLDILAGVGILLGVTAGRGLSARLGWYSAGLGCLVTADTWFLWLTAKGEYQGAAPPPTLFWFAGFLAIAMAGTLQARPVGEARRPAPTLPLLVAIVCFAVAAVSDPSRIVTFMFFVAVGALVVRSGANAQARVQADREVADLAAKTRRVIAAMPTNVAAATGAASRAHDQTTLESLRRIADVIDLAVSSADFDNAAESSTASLARTASRDVRRLIDALTNRDTMPAMDTAQLRDAWLLTNTPEATLNDTRLDVRVDRGELPGPEAAIAADLGNELIAAALTDAASRVRVRLTVANHAAIVDVDHDGGEPSDASHVLIAMASSVAAAVGGTVSTGSSNMWTRLTASVPLPPVGER